MPKKRYRPEEIIGKLREADVLIRQGKKGADVIEALGITDVTYYRWRQEGLKVPARLPKRSPSRGRGFPIPGVHWRLLEGSYTKIRADRSWGPGSSPCRVAESVHRSAPAI